MNTMNVWRRAKLLKWVCVVFSVGLGRLFVRGEEAERIFDLIRSLSEAEVDYESTQGGALTESNIRFPTAQSFFLWLGSFHALESSCRTTFGTISDEIPQMGDSAPHVFSMKAYSSVLQCLELMRISASTYSLSLSSPDQDMFSEVSDVSVDNIVKECLAPCTHTLLDLYVKVHMEAFSSGKVYSPALLKASERILELYHTVWEVLTMILGYISMVRQSLASVLRGISEIQERLLSAEPKKEMSALEQLELNISRRRLTDLERKKSLYNLLILILQGNLSLSVKASEMESLIMDENKRSISELEESISAAEKSIKCEERGKESESTRLLSALRKELGLRTEELSLQISGTPVYRKLVDANLQALFESLSSEPPGPGPSGHPQRAGEAEAEAEAGQTVLSADPDREQADPAESGHHADAGQQGDG